MIRARITVDDLPDDLDRQDIENEIIIALGLHFTEGQISVEFEDAA